MHQRPLEREYIYCYIIHKWLEIGASQPLSGVSKQLPPSSRKATTSQPHPHSLSSCQSLKLAYFTLATKFQLLSHSFFFYFGLARVRLLNFCFTVFKLSALQFSVFYLLLYVYKCQAYPRVGSEKQPENPEYRGAQLVLAARRHAAIHLQFEHILITQCTIHCL